MNREQAVLRQPFHSNGCCRSRGGWALRRTSVLARLARSGADARPAGKTLARRFTESGCPAAGAEGQSPFTLPASCLLSSLCPCVFARNITPFFSSLCVHLPRLSRPLPFVKGKGLRPGERIAFGASQDTSGDVRRVPRGGPKRIILYTHRLGRAATTKARQDRVGLAF